MWPCPPRCGGYCMWAVAPLFPHRAHSTLLSRDNKWESAFQNSRLHDRSFKGARGKVLVALLESDTESFARTVTGDQQLPERYSHCRRPQV